jgi:phage tail sheath protein FI
MAISLTFPGVRVQELPSAVRTITGVATSITGFVGRAWSGVVNQATPISSFADYVQQFGGHWRESTMSYAVEQFFANGGDQAVIVRVHNGAVAAELSIGLWTFVAASPGSWGNNLKVTIDRNVKAPDDPALFNVTVLDDGDSFNDALRRGGSDATETFLNVSIDPASPRYVKTVLEQQSSLVRFRLASPKLPPVFGGPSPFRPPIIFASGPSPAQPTLAVLSVTGTDGTTVAANELVSTSDPGTGIFALDQVDVINLLCIPPADPSSDNDRSIWDPAADYCATRRALLIVDAPGSWSVSDAVQSMTSPASQGVLTANPDRAAIYFPRVLLPDPLQGNKLRDFAPSGVVAGVYARTDADRGVWKAPAGVDTNLTGVSGLIVAGTPRTLTDDEIGQLNPLGINSLRSMPVIGPVVWGARTMDGADVRASQWKYVPVRRLALFIEESLFRGTQWVVFEPNDETLWSQIRLNVGAFMQSLFQQGAFQGDTPDDAYFVQCSSETTTPTDIDNGVVNVVVGFAPVKPAEFVILKIQQISEQP